ncbi:NAD(P)/FAD-dependent oxidoreductase [Caenimonas soli]|uniref:NAD(P)/FAD-dependent oxidoreductase n=1 Tax=Caenimonas soli TaxID=2735555 RepID=UPI0015579470|nr:FAD-dependent oxidoreductase [Caenimonas soli]NPC58333.1 FAD-binding oxidoreductase [Caenimonas soli]
MEKAVAPYAPLRDPGEMPSTVFTAGAGEPLNGTRLTGEVKADIVVVGGGIAGVSAALHAAESGSRVVVLEANSIGWGASGRNAGHLAPASKMSWEEAERLYGPVVGERFNQAAESGPELVFRLAEKYGIDAEAQRTGMLIAAHSEAAARALETRANELQRLGKPVQFLDRKAASQVVGSEFYLGAFHDSRGGSINPLAYVRGLARAAVAAGAEVHENSRAVSIAKRGLNWEVRTSSGCVVGAHVLICTNAYTDELWPGLKQSIIPARSYHVGTQPLPKDLQTQILPRREVMTDSRRLLLGIRVCRNGQLHFNGYGPALGPDTGLDVASTLRRVEEIFPQLKPLQIQYQWHGWMAMSRVGTWEVHELAPGVTAALGCNGRGVAMATFIGRDIADFALGKPRNELVVPLTALKRIPLHFMHALPVRALVSWRQWKDRLEMQRLRGVPARD